MSKVRKVHVAEFKTQLNLGTIREEATITQLSSRYSVHATAIYRWKKEALAAMSASFSGKQERQGNDHLTAIKALHVKIGQLTIERGFLVDSSKQWGLCGGKKW